MSELADVLITDALADVGLLAAQGWACGKRFLEQFACNGRPLVAPAQGAAVGVRPVTAILAAGQDTARSRLRNDVHNPNPANGDIPRYWGSGDAVIDQHHAAPRRHVTP